MCPELGLTALDLEITQVIAIWLFRVRDHVRQCWHVGDVLLFLTPLTGPCQRQNNKNFAFRLVIIVGLYGLLQKQSNHFFHANQLVKLGD